MKKFSLLLGTLGGAMAGYLFSNTKLRKELSRAKDAEAAARTLGKYLQHDGKKLAKQIQEFVKSEEVQEQVQKAKKFAKSTFDQAKQELRELAQEGTERAARTAKKGAARARKAAKRTAQRVRMKTKTLL
jgi:hypothetical protein